MSAPTPKLPKAVIEDVKKQFEPLFLQYFAGSPSYKIMNKSLGEIVKKLFRLTEINRTFLEIQGSSISKKASATLMALWYLTNVELSGSVLVDIAILLLVTQGRPLHIEPDFQHRFTRHAASLEDLESPALPLSIKLDFLELNGVPLYSKMIDRELRNRIAHLEFEVEDNGDFFTITKRGGRKKVDLLQKGLIFNQYEDALRNVIVDQFARTGRSKGQGSNRKT